YFFCRVPWIVSLLTFYAYAARPSLAGTGVAQALRPLAPSLTPRPPGAGFPPIRVSCLLLEVDPQSHPAGARRPGADEHGPLVGQAVQHLGRVLAQQAEVLVLPVEEVGDAAEQRDDAAQGIAAAQVHHREAVEP